METCDGQQRRRGTKRPRSTSANEEEDQNFIDPNRPCTNLADLIEDVLEKITTFLDSASFLSLFRTCKSIRRKLFRSGHWQRLCQTENFKKYSALKIDDEDDDKERLTWSGENFHDLEIPSEASHWHKVYLRGVQMRRNIVLGRFEHWRLFLTGHEHLPVVKMTSATTNRQLRLRQRGAPVGKLKGLAHRQCYWNEEYMFMLLHDDYNQVNTIFVWSLKVGQTPRFLYTCTYMEDLGLSSTNFFLYKNYLVLMPNENKSMIRVHDLSDNMVNVGSFDFPDGLRRYLQHDAVHLCSVGEDADAAMAICRAPEFRLFVFSLPGCTLLQETLLPILSQNDRLDELSLTDEDENLMLFIFYDRDFDVDEEQEKFGGLLYVDFKDFKSKKEPIKARLDPCFNSSRNYVETFAILTRERLICCLTSGKIIIRDINASAEECDIIFHVDRITIPCPEPLKSKFAFEADSDSGVGQSLCVASDRKMFAVLRNFRSGRKIQAYSSEGINLYSIDLRNPLFGLASSNIFMETFGKFLFAANGESILIWYMETGRYVRTIAIPRHNQLRSKGKSPESYHDIAFQEDSIIIVHSAKDFPVAADVINFW